MLVVVSPGCSVLQKIIGGSAPEFKIRDFSIKEFNIDSITFHVDSELINHMHVPLPQSALKLDLNINDQRLSAIQSAPFSVKANGATPVPLDVKIGYIDLYRIVTSLSLIESFKVGLNGSADFPLSVPGLPEKVSVPFNLEKTVPSFLPNISIDSVQVRRPDLSSIAGAIFSGEIPLGLDLDLTVKNQGGAKFNVKDLGYSMLLGGKNVFEGKTSTTETSEDGKSSKVKIRTDLPLKESVKAILPMLQGNTINYQLKGNANLKFAGVDLSDVKLPLDKAGTVGF